MTVLHYVCAPILSLRTCPLGVQKKGEGTFISPWDYPNMQLPFIALYLEDFRPCVEGLTIVNAIGTHLGGLINLGLTRWLITVLMKTVVESGRKDWSPVKMRQIMYRFGK